MAPGNRQGHDHRHGGVETCSSMKLWILRLRLYRLAAWLYETYRLIAKPCTQGSLVALWHQGRVLLVAATYRRELSLSGGWIKRRESAQRPAQRELAEELGLHVQEAQLSEPWAFGEHSARGVNTVWIFAMELAEHPVLEVVEPVIHLSSPQLCHTSVKSIHSLGNSWPPASWSTDSMRRGGCRLVQTKSLRAAQREIAGGRAEHRYRDRGPFPGSTQQRHAGLHR